MSSNRSALTVIPETLRLDAVEYFAKLATGWIGLRGFRPGDPHAGQAEGGGRAERTLSPEKEREDRPRSPRGISGGTGSGG